MIKNNLRTALFIVAAAFVSFVCNVLIASDNTKSPQQQYIYKYSALAIEEMYRSGVPASITLAQGLLESRYGLSALAVDGNNHFGIKCHNWAGRKMYHDDDKKGECFRKYDSPEESFRDHSDFLRYRDRYKFLFDLEPTDYKGWAHGLKKAGYATDPSYPQKLIKLIEDYGLYKYDTCSQDVTPQEDAKEQKSEQKKAKKADKKEHKADKKKSSGKDKHHTLPESPSRIEQPKPLTRKQSETFHFALTRQMYSMNGVPFIYATSGETYSDIASRYNLFLRELLKFNDLSKEETLYPGTVVYLQKKKKKAAYGMDKYIVEGDGEDLRSISQRFAVRLDRLCKMNGISQDKKLRDGDVIKLR